MFTHSAKPLKYVFESVTPLFPFGHGLSYTTYVYESIAVSTKTISRGQSITATVKVTNKGTMAGSEVVQVYISFPVSPFVRYRKWLAGFEKVFIAPGQSVDVPITIPKEVMQYYDRNAALRIDEGTHVLYTGQNSADEALSATFTVTA